MFFKKQKNLKPITYNLKAKNGFTLIEILLVTFIAGLVFIGIYLLYAMTIKQDVESRYEIIASNLAQEGIETIRNIRDEEILAGNDIDSWIPASGVCHPRISASGDGNCGNGATLDDVALDGGGYFNCQGSCGAGAQETPFERVCSIADQDTDSDGDDDTLVVTCTVSWNSFVNPAISRDVEATSVLTDWDAD